MRVGRMQLAGLLSTIELHTDALVLVCGALQ